MKSLYLAIALGMSANSYAKTIVVTTGEWQPYTGEKLADQGFVSKITKEALKKAGYDSEVVFKKWKKAMKLVEKKPKKFSGTIPWFKTPEREKKFFFSQPIVKTVNVFYKLKKTPALKINKPEDLKGTKLGLTLGYSYGVELDQAVKDKKMESKKVKSDEAGIKALLSGEIDYFPVEKFVGKSLLSKLSSSQQATLEPVNAAFFKDAPVYFIVSKNHPTGSQLIKDFDRGLGELRSSGKLMEIVNKAFAN